MNGTFIKTQIASHLLEISNLSKEIIKTLTNTNSRAYIKGDKLILTSEGFFVLEVEALDLNYVEVKSMEHLISSCSSTVLTATDKVLFLSQLIVDLKRVLLEKSENMETNLGEVDINALVKSDYF